MSLNDLQSEFLKENKNVNTSLLASTARTASNNSADFINKHNVGAHFIIDVTVVPSVETVTFTVQGKDSVSGKYYDLIVSAALVATGTVILKVYPGITVVANLSVSDILPDTYRVKVTHSASGSFTYSIASNLV